MFHRFVHRYGTPAGPVVRVPYSAQVRVDYTERSATGLLREAIARELRAPTACDPLHHAGTRGASRLLVIASYRRPVIATLPAAADPPAACSRGGRPRAELLVQRRGRLGRFVQVQALQRFGVFAVYPVDRETVPLGVMGLHQHLDQPGVMRHQL